MDDKAMMGLDYVRVLREEWGADLPAPAAKGRTLRLYALALWQLGGQIHGLARQVPSHYDMIDWFGRRLITWGWQLRTRYGSRRR